MSHLQLLSSPWRHSAMTPMVSQAQVCRLPQVPEVMGQALQVGFIASSLPRWRRQVGREHLSTRKLSKETFPVHSPPFMQAGERTVPFVTCLQSCHSLCYGVNLGGLSRNGQRKSQLNILQGLSPCMSVPTGSLESPRDVSQLSVRRDWPGAVQRPGN